MSARTLRCTGCCRRTSAIWRTRRRAACKQLRGRATDFGRYALLRDLQDTNETLFYALLVRNIEEMMPLVYTPTVGEGCQRFSEIWRKPRGLFLSYPNKNRIRQILAHHRYDAVRAIVVSDGERILGPRRSGRGWHGHSDRQACAVQRVRRNPSRRCACRCCSMSAPTTWSSWKIPMYIGWRHHRIRGSRV